ncbi:MAG TPA: DUF2267 domain-containing protein [Anaerolineae bacterium]
MAQTQTMELTDYYQRVQKMGNLRTPAHGRRWSGAVLKTLGLNLDGKTKKKLARALPPELAEDLTRTFWLLHFRDPNLSGHEFQSQVARRSGNTDADFARFPILAVFHHLKQLIDPDLSQQVAQSLSPEVAELWRQA